MKFTVLVTDEFLRFRLLAIPHPPANPLPWQLNVTTIEDVADVLEGLGFTDPESVQRLAQAGPTITPVEGLKTLPIAHLLAITELVDLEYEPPPAEAQEGYMLIVPGETTEENLATMGFVAVPKGPLQ